MNNTEEILTRIVTRFEQVGRFRAAIIGFVFPEIAGVLEDVNELCKEHKL